jgi:hypothetical protein
MKKSDYTKDYLEWQDKQYIPGYFNSQGRVPVYIKYFNSKINLFRKMLLLLPFLLIIIFLLVAAYSFVSNL